MNPKIILAFVGGLILASGLTYIAVKQDAPAPVQSAEASAPAPVVTPAPPAEEPTAEAPEATPPASAPVAKPSPVRSRSQQVVRSARPAAVPQRNEPKSPPPQEPVTVAAAPPPVETPEPPPESTPEPEPAEPRPVAPSPESLAPPPPNQVTIPAGTLLTVRLSEGLSSDRNAPGDQFSAVLDQPLSIDGFVLAERGARARGRIVELDRAGKVRGIAHMSIELTQIRTSDGQNIKINTGAFQREGETSKKKDAAKVGVGAAIGAAIGAIAGGGKGAAVGAGVGGAAGAGQVLLTRGKAAELPVETRISFRLAEPVTITEKN